MIVQVLVRVPGAAPHVRSGLWQEPASAGTGAARSRPRVVVPAPLSGPSRRKWSRFADRCDGGVTEVRDRPYPALAPAAVEPRMYK